MTQDVEEYEFYEKRRLKEKITGKSAEGKREFLLGERTVAKNRMERLQEEINKLNAMIKLVKVMEKDLDGRKGKGKTRRAHKKAIPTYI